MSDGDTDTETEALQTIAGGAAWVMGGRVAKLALLFGIQVFMARMLTPASYGGVIIGSVVISVGTMLGALGLPGGLTRKVAYYEDTPAKARGAFWTGVLLGALSGVLVGAAVYLTAPFLASRVFQSPDIVPILHLTAIAIPFSILTGIGISIAKASRDATTHVFIRQLLKPVTKVVFVAVFVSVLGLGAVGAMSGIVLSIVIGGIGALLLAYRVFQTSLRGETDTMYLELLTFSLPLMFAAGTSFLIENTDTLLIGAYLSTTAVSEYDVAFKLQQMGTVFFFPATFLLPPVLTRLQKAGQMAEARVVYQVATKWMTLLSLPLFLAIFLFPETVIRLTFGGKYLAGAQSLRILAVPILVTVAFGANGASLTGLGHNRINLYVNGSMAVLNVCLNVLLIPVLGISGAAIASAAAFVGRDSIFTVALYRWYGIHPFSRAMVKPLVGAALATPVGYALVRMASVTDAQIVFLFGAFVVVVYLPLVIRLGAIEARDVRVFDRFESSVGVDLGVVRSSIRWLQG